MALFKNIFTKEDFAAAAVNEDVDPAQRLQGCPAADTTTHLKDASVREDRDRRTRRSSARGR